MSSIRDREVANVHDSMNRGLSWLADQALLCSISLLITIDEVCPFTTYGEMPIGIGSEEIPFDFFVAFKDTLVRN